MASPLPALVLVAFLLCPSGALQILSGTSAKSACSDADGNGALPPPAPPPPFSNASEIPIAARLSGGKGGRPVTGAVVGAGVGAGVGVGLVAGGGLPGGGLRNPNDCYINGTRQFGVNCTTPPTSALLVTPPPMPSLASSVSPVSGWILLTALMALAVVASPKSWP